MQPNYNALQLQSPQYSSLLMQLLDCLRHQQLDYSVLAALAQSTQSS